MPGREKRRRITASAWVNPGSEGRMLMLPTTDVIAPGRPLASVRAREIRSSSVSLTLRRDEA